MVPTLTLLPQTGSPIIDAVPTASCPVGADQRGYARPDNLEFVCDIGAVETGASPAPPLPTMSAGSVAWHPHHAVHLSDGLTANIDAADGHVDVDTGDLRIPGRGRDLTFDHVWDSTLAHEGLTTTVGQGWLSRLTPRIGGDIRAVLTYTDTTGATYPFVYTGAMTATAPYTAYRPPAGEPWQLTASSTAYTLTNFLTGDVRSFDGQGHLLADVDAYGNSNTLSGGPVGPTGETNSGNGMPGSGRTLAYTYTNGLLSEVAGPAWQKGGSAVAGSQHVTYAYKNASQLQTVTRGAGTTNASVTRFGYDPTGTQLITITTPGGHAWVVGYTAEGRLASITSPVSGSVPAYTTAFAYAAGQTVMVEGYGSPAPVTTTYMLDAQGELVAVTDALSDTTSYVYDANHDITSTTDARGNTTAYSYTYVGPSQNVGLLTQRTDPPIAAYTTTNSLVSPVTTYSYNLTTDDLSEVDSPEGGRTLYGYDGYHSVITTTQLLQSPPSGGVGCPQVVQRNYAQVAARTDVHTLTSCVSNTWRASVNQLDQYGEITGTVDGRGVDISGNLTPTVTLDPVNAPLVMRRYVYTPQGDLSSVSTPPITTTLNGVRKANQPVTVSYGYDADGNQTAITSTNGYKTTVSYDHLGRPVMTTAPSVPLYDGSTKSPTVTLGYDGDGNVATTVDALSERVTRSYDPLGRVVAQTNPLGRTALYTYTATTLAATQDYSGNVTQYGDDAAGRLVATIDPLGTHTQAALDAMGNSTAITTPLDYAHVQTTTVEQRGYDALNRVITDGVQGTGGVAPAVPQVSTTSYDKDGNVALRVSPAGSLTYNTYDLTDRLANTAIFTDPAQSPLAQQSVTLDPADNPVAAMDLQGHDHHALFDGANRVSQATDCAQYCGGIAPIVTTPGYDPDGNVLALTQTVGSVMTTTTAGYNALDWLTTQNDGLGATVYGYDAVGRLRTQSLLGGRGVVTGTVNQEGLTTGIAESVTDAVTSPVRSGSTSIFTYTLDDLLLTDTLDSGVVTASVAEARAYDADNRVTGLQASGATLAQGYGYGYDPQGHTITVTISGYPTQQLTYDAHGWLQQDVAGTGGTPPSWQYDANGNLTQALHAGTVLKYSYAVAAGQATPPHALPNELVSTLGTGLSATGYSYDNSGNTAVIVQATNGYSLTYDAQDRLTTVVLTDTSGLGRNASVTIAYNARGLRARYTVTRSGQSLPAFDERLLYRGARVGQVAVTGTQVTAPFTETFVYRPTGSPLELLYQQAKQGTQRYWYVLDGRGNVTALVNATGVAVNHYYYDAWGVPASPDGGITAGTTELVHQPLRYGGYWYDGWDDSLGTSPDQGWNMGALPWYALGPRSYDPVLERFLQPDPATRGSLPDYAYANNDPLDVTDPTGRAGVPTGCASGDDVGTPGNAAGCALAGAQQAADAQRGQALSLIANVFTLGLYGSVESAFGPGSGLGERALGIVGLVPFVGEVGRGVGLAADAVDAARAAEDAARLADEGAQALPVSASIETGSLGGQLYPAAKLEQLGSYLAKRGVALKVGDEFLPPDARGVFAVYNSGGAELVLGSNPTAYEVWHELSHYIQYRRIGEEAYTALSRSRELGNVPEQFVFDMLENSPKRWSALTYEEQQHAIAYIERVGGFR